MEKEVCVQSWPCSYFLNRERRWLPGKLSLTPTHLRFKAESTSDYLVNFHLSSICEIKKESSSYIFSSITVLEKDQAKHWFSSLQPNRSVVFNIIEHFWREQLLSSQGAQDTSSKNSTGQELVNIASGSQKQMEDTTKVLHHQGQQFENIMKGLNKIEGDMATADRMLCILESPSWWPFSMKPWKSASCVQRKETSMDSSSQVNDKEGSLLMIPVIFSNKPDQQFKPGKLTLLPTALEIWDCNSQLVHRYEIQDVDDIKIFTGYDISVRQRFIGKPDITYRILSAKLPDIIPILEMQYSKKIEFLEDSLMFREAWKHTPSDGSSPILETGSWYIDAIVKSESFEEGRTEMMMQSQAEAQELRKILMKLKCIALEAESELERQDEMLEDISSSGDRALGRIDKNVHRMRKLL
ncbi:synaptosomal-associated 47 [Pelobates cultripes]|uniref:Synaptosomal-associated protein 47 n=1 Tax=Pelobates cultripes TaxID=61616 RepID=A0AAD1RV23_PELCU|nr:synaptosomal-associated 47 [Pelobates cultripes]